MYIQFSNQISQLFRKVVETLLDGSELGMIIVDKGHFEIKATDSLWNCESGMYYEYDTTTVGNITEPFTVRINLRDIWYNFVKKYTHASFGFAIVQGKRCIFANVRSKQYSQNIKPLYMDDTCYTTIPREAFHKWVRIDIETSLINDIFLKLNIAGGRLAIKVHSHGIMLSSGCASADIWIDVKQEKPLVNFTKEFTNKHIGKFFKQFCGMLQSNISANFRMLLAPDQPVILQLIYPRLNFAYHSAIAPVYGNT